MKSIFDSSKIYATYVCGIYCHTLVSGTPKNPKQMASWLKVSMGESGNNMYMQTLRELYPGKMDKIDKMYDGPEKDAAMEEMLEEAAALQGTAFKRTPDGLPYIEGRQVKAMLKEAGNIAMSGIYLKIGKGRAKTAQSFLAERVFVVEDRIPLSGKYKLRDEVRVINVPDPRIPDKKNGSFKPYEIATDAILRFNVYIDKDAEEILNPLWESILVRAQQNGLGADRSMGMGRFEVIEWAKTSG